MLTGIFWHIEKTIFIVWLLECESTPMTDIMDIQWMGNWPDPIVLPAVSNMHQSLCNFICGRGLSSLPFSHFMTLFLCFYCLKGKLTEWHDLQIWLISGHGVLRKYLQLATAEPITVKEMAENILPSLTVRLQSENIRGSKINSDGVWALQITSFQLSFASLL